MTAAHTDKTRLEVMQELDDYLYKSLPPECQKAIIDGLKLKGEESVFVKSLFAKPSEQNEELREIRFDCTRRGIVNNT